MFNEIKQFKVEELNNRKQALEAQIGEIRQQVIKIKVELDDLKWKKDTRITLRSDFSFLEKFVTRRAEYRKYKKQLKEIEADDKRIAELEEQFAVENQNAVEEVKRSGLGNELKTVLDEIDNMRNIKTIYELGYSPLEAMALLESKGITPVLTEADKEVAKHPRDYSSKSNLICVHKTKYIPTGSKIRTGKDSHAMMKKQVTLNGETYEISYESGRDTIHMSMNDEVSSHMYGSWDDCKYAILMPFEDIPNEKIGFAAPMDTFTRGSLDLSENAWILCPKDEVERIKTLNPNLHVLGYEGDSVMEYSQPFLTQLGYRAEDVGMWGWGDEESSKAFRELIQREGIEQGVHAYTYFHEDEVLLTNINYAISLCKLIRDNNLVKNREDAENIVKQLIENNHSLGAMLSDLGKETSAKGYIGPDAIIGNGKQASVFIAEMEKNGFPISPAYQGVLQQLSAVSMYKCNSSNADMIFDILENASETERRAITELREGLVFDNYVDAEKKLDAFTDFLTSMMTDVITNSQTRERDVEYIQE